MPVQFEIVHLLLAAQGYLAEIRRLDLPSDAPKGRRYHWLWIEDGTVSSLLFLSIDDTTGTRSFEDAQLRFDAGGAELRWHGGRAITLTADAHRVLPAALRWLVHEHLS
jgi:hypothetical protein